MCAGAAADQAGLAEAGHHPLEAGAQHLGGLLGGARGGQAGGQDVGRPGPGAACDVFLLFQMVYKLHLSCRRCVRTAKPSCTLTKDWVLASLAPSATGT